MLWGTFAAGVVACAGVVSNCSVAVLQFNYLCHNHLSVPCNAMGHAATQVMSGKDKGKQGEVMRVIRNQRFPRVFVAGANMVRG